MSYEQEVMQFLSRPENLPIALEVAVYVEQIKSALHEKFWNELAINLRQRLNTSAFQEHWRVDAPEDVTKPYAKCVFHPKGPTAPSPIRIGIEQNTRQGNYALYYGMHWAHQKPAKADQIEAVEILRQELLAQGFVKESNWWLGWQWLNVQVYSAPVLQGMSADSAAFVDTFAEKIWETFLQFRPLAEEVNAKLIAP